jgi:hypothetical protein
MRLGPFEESRQRLGVRRPSAALNARRSTVTLSILLLGLSVGCAPSRNSAISRGFDRRIPEEMAWIRQQLASVSLADGVSQDEANKLAIAYWTRFCPRCGIVNPAKDAAEYWKAPFSEGYIPVRRDPILIHKSSGHISWKGGPTVTNWNQLTE